MNYYKRISGIRTFHQVEVEKETYDELLNAKKNLSESLGIEEKFEVLISNYESFELTLLDLTNHYLIRNVDTAWSNSSRAKINRELINFLTSARLYIDHVKHHCSSIFGKESDTYDNIEQLFSSHYDKYLGYRFFESLRNYVQHRGFPIHQVSYLTSHEFGKEKIDRKSFVVTPIVLVSKLKEDKGFKTTVLRELEENGEEIDIKPHIRVYITSLATIHSEIREQIRELLENSESIFREELNRFIEETGLDSVTGFEVLEVENNELESGFHFNENLIDRRKILTETNRKVDNLIVSQVSNQIVKKEID